MKTMTTIKNLTVPSEASEKYKRQQALKLTEDDQGKLAFENEVDRNMVLNSLKNSFGTMDEHLIMFLGMQIISTLQGPTIKNSTDQLNTLMPILIGINPQDEIEGMLAVQMIGVHNLAMEMLERAMLKDQPTKGVNEIINRITKLTRTFTAQMEALNKHRGKGQQRMVVEHVHVHKGGQAIVGNVDQGG
jgi:hypothetical protein